MRELLNAYYGIDGRDEVTIDEKTGFESGEYIYFTIRIGNKKEIFMEQAFLAHYLNDKGFKQVASPIMNLKGDWITSIDGHHYIVVKVLKHFIDLPQSHGEILAYFHLANASYHYTPQNISSYGKWKQLWIDKLTAYEVKLIEEANKTPKSYYRELMDFLPYFIGISENAIQYMRESEQDGRYDESDAGTITFHRYEDQLMKKIIWPNDIVYDHSMRDIAEFIRIRLLNYNQSQSGIKEILSFLKEYQSIRSPSIFSWRILYARLLFPIHFFDLIEEAFLTEHSDTYDQRLSQLLENQPSYEKALKELYHLINVHIKKIDIPMIQWL